MSTFGLHLLIVGTYLFSFDLLLLVDLLDSPFIRISSIPLCCYFNDFVIWHGVRQA